MLVFYAVAVSTPGTSSQQPSADANPRTTTIYAVVGLVFSLLSWVINPFFVPSIVGVAISIWVLLRAKRFVGRPHTVILLLAILGLVLGLVGLIGSLLSLFVKVG